MLLIWFLLGSSQGALLRGTSQSKGIFLINEITASIDHVQYTTTFLVHLQK